MFFTWLAKHQGRENTHPDFVDNFAVIEYLMAHSKNN